MNMSGLGIDISEVSRFKTFKKNSRFVLNNYNRREIDYCFNFKDPGPHLAGIFSAKEAVFKAMKNPSLVLLSIEIRPAQNGRPEVWIKDRRKTAILVSISHVAMAAVAVAIKK